MYAGRDFTSKTSLVPTPAFVACSTITASDKRWSEKAWDRGYPKLPALGYLTVYQFGFHSSTVTTYTVKNLGLIQP